MLMINMKHELLFFFSHSVPPSKPYFMVDTATPWVAGKKYAVTCIAPDAKPEAEITLYKGESPLFNCTKCDRDGQLGRLEQRATASPISLIGRNVNI